MTMNFLHTQIYGIVAAVSISILTLSSTIDGFTIELIPRTSIDSPLFPKHLSIEQTHQRIAELSRAYTFHIVPMNSAKSSLHTLNHEPDETPKPPVVLSPPFANLYLTNMSIGSKNFSPLLVVDTGGDDIWLQWEGCTSCFPVKGGSFPAKESKTYRSLACKHQLCVPKLCTKGGKCSYNSKYRDDGVTKGVLSSESFTFPGNKSASITFPSIIFGCGYDNKNITFGGISLGGDHIISEVFGLGAGQRSILRQSEPQTKLRFSYCLRSYLTNFGKVNTFLRFGPDAQIKGDDKEKVQTIKFTPNLPRYYVNVTGISVAGKRHNIDPKLFEPKKGGSGGFAI